MRCGLGRGNSPAAPARRTRGLGGPQRDASVPAPTGRSGSRVGAAGADWLAGARAGWWRRGGAGHPAAGLGLHRWSPRPARAPAATRPPPAATMSTGLRYKSKLATPGEPGACPRARARLCPRRPPASHRLSPSLPCPPARTRPDPPRPGPRPRTTQRTNRYRRRAARLVVRPDRLSPIVAPMPVAPRRDPAPAGRHPALWR